MMVDNRKSGKMTLEEIKKVLIVHYAGGGSLIRAGLNSRKLTVLPYTDPGNSTGVAVYFFVLSGSPPKGYGIYVKWRRSLCLYDANGKRFKEYYLDKGVVFEEGKKRVKTGLIPIPSLGLVGRVATPRKRIWKVKSDFGVKKE